LKRKAFLPLFLGSRHFRRDRIAHGLGCRINEQQGGFRASRNSENALARLLVGPGLLGCRLVAAFMFRFSGGPFLARFFTPMFLPIVVVAGRFFTRVFRTPVPLRFLAWGLDAAQRASEIFDLPFITNLLFFRGFNQFQNVFHLFEGVFE
jgi:hypothetical protein